MCVLLQEILSEALYESRLIGLLELEFWMAAWTSDCMVWERAMGMRSSEDTLSIPMSGRLAYGPLQYVVWH